MTATNRKVVSVEFSDRADEMNRLAGLAACLLAILSRDQQVLREIDTWILIQAWNHAEDIGKGLSALLRSDAS